MRVFGLFVLLMSFSIGSALAGGIRLENASYKSALSLFAAITGNTYIGDFTTDKQITYFTEKDVSPAQAHDILKSLVNAMGGQISETSTNEFSITTAKTDDQQVPVIEEVLPIVNIIKRIDLDEKISFNVLNQVVQLDTRFKDLKIIEDDKGAKTIIVIGSADSIAVLELVIEGLPKLKPLVEKVTEKIVAKEIVKLDQIKIPEIIEDQKVIRIIDLNYADSMSLNEPLKALSENGNDGGDVVVYNNTNQIVLQGPQDWIDKMSVAIRKLDRKPRQIFVDAIIAEISDQTTKRLGLQFSGSKGKLGVGNFTDNAGTNLSSFGTNGQLSSVTGGVISIGPGATLVPNMGALLTALEADTQNRILATPSLMTTENSEASILVGQNVPFITGKTSSSADGTISPFQTIQRQDLGTILKLKPRIGRNGEVVLSIRQEVSRIDNTTSGLSDVATVKREIDTVVSTKSGQIIVIGGLRTKSLETSKSNTPGLSDIPLFGVLFKQNGSKIIERSLAIFLKATVVTERNSKIRILEKWEGEFDKSFDNLNSDKLDEKIILNGSISKP
ncbi:hypothetical protein N9805_02250 [Paracoccaceae bacterium]|nr:hypothetical protein [Paracoccaceae bacterium]